jgi:hypothetical protein
MTRAEQFFLPKVIDLMDACCQRCQLVRLSLQSRRFSAGWPVYRRLTGIDDARPPSVEKMLGNDALISSVSPCSKACLIGSIEMDMGGG